LHLNWDHTVVQLNTKKEIIPMNTQTKLYIISGLILIGAVALGACSSFSPNSASAGAAELPDIPAQQVVQEFYDWYTTFPGHPIVSGAYADHPLVGDALVNAVEKEREGGLVADPILCAQDVPDRVTAGEAVVDGSTARVHVTTSWEGHALDVELQIVDGEWKISNVICNFH
jgi:hypothetical protein